MLAAILSLPPCSFISNRLHNPDPKLEFSIRQPFPAMRRRRVAASVPDPLEGVNVEYTPWLIAGLGNPGNKYHETRHNLPKWSVCSVLVSVAGGIRDGRQHSSGRRDHIEHGTIQGLSRNWLHWQGTHFTCEATGLHELQRRIGPLAAYYQVPLRHVLLMYDEMSLPNGVLRLSRKGGHGHHNGVKSVIDHMDGCRDFPRLCIGVGNPPGQMDIRAFLLQKFSLEEQEQVDAALEQGVEAVRTLLLKGFNESINQFNLAQKYKFHQV